MAQFESIELHLLRLEVKRLAEIGYGAWRIPDVDRKLLGRTPLVAAALAALPKRARSHPDALWDAIEEGLQTAMTMLPPQEMAAALEHFGFGTRVGGGDGSDLTQRKENAAQQLLGGRSRRWYTSPRSYSLGLAPEDYIVELVVAALAGIEDPLTWVRARAPKPIKEREERLTIEAKHYHGILMQAMIFANAEERRDWVFGPRPRRRADSLARYQFHHHLRVCLEGPAFLHPLPYFLPTGPALEDDGGETPLSDFVGRHVRTTCQERNPHVRIALICDDAYYWRIARFINPDDYDDFFKACAFAVDELFGPNLERGPDLVVGSKNDFRAGFVTHDLAMRRIAGDWMPYMHRANDPKNWRREFLRQFDDAFDAEYEGQEAAYEKLVAFIARGRDMLKTPGVEVFWLDGQVRIKYPDHEEWSAP